METEKAVEEKPVETEEKVNLISIDEFAKVELKVGQVIRLVYIRRRNLVLELWKRKVLKVI